MLTDFYFADQSTHTDCRHATASPDVRLHEEKMTLRVGIWSRVYQSLLRKRKLRNFENVCFNLRISNLSELNLLNLS